VISGSQLNPLEKSRPHEAQATGQTGSAVSGQVMHGERVELPRKARILVVEDDAFVREGLVRLINRQSDLICCGEADGVAAAAAIMAKDNGANADLMLLDLELGDGDGFEVINCVRAGNPHPAILLLSHCAEAGYAERALRAGARGYVVKQEAAEEVLTAMRAVLRGGIYVSRAMAGRLLQRMVNTPEYYAGGSGVAPTRPRKIS
jgi:DNA-binding NarL/FixJ family response regulator